jgi:hypothetical protein
MLRMAGDGAWAGNIFLRNSALQCVWASLRPLAGNLVQSRQTGYAMTTGATSFIGRVPMTVSLATLCHG